MFEFECWHDNNGEQWAKQNYIAETPGKAKRQHYEYLQDGLWEEDFFTVIKGMKCRKTGIARVESLFSDTEQFDRNKEYRNIPFAYQGMRISVCGKMGTIVGSNSSCNLDVVYDGNWHTNNCHPWYETVYYDRDGSVIADYRKGVTVSE